MMQKRFSQKLIFCVSKPFPGTTNSSVENNIESLIREAMKNKNLQIDYVKYSDEIKRESKR